VIEPEFGSKFGTTFLPEITRLLLVSNLGFLRL
jgi:hypothetical protein